MSQWWLAYFFDTENYPLESERYFWHSLSRVQQTRQMLFIPSYLCYDIMLLSYKKILNYCFPLTKGEREYGEQLKRKYLIMSDNEAEVSLSSS